MAFMDEWASVWRKLWSFVFLEEEDFTALECRDKVIKVFWCLFYSSHICGSMISKEDVELGFKSNGIIWYYTFTYEWKEYRKWVTLLAIVLNYIIQLMGFVFLINFGFANVYGWLDIERKWSRYLYSFYVVIFGFEWFVGQMTLFFGHPFISESRLIDRC